MFFLDPKDINPKDLESLSVLADTMNADEDSDLGEFLQELISMVEEGPESIIFIHFKDPSSEASKAP